jgi:hypothetical protein
MPETLLTLILITPTAAALALAARWTLKAPRIAEATNKLLDNASLALAGWISSKVGSSNDAIEAAYVEGYENGKADTERRTTLTEVVRDEPLGGQMLQWIDDHLDVELTDGQRAFIEARYR